ncbi:NAD(P)-binding protein [Auricularia subglabra TFB-10046 SS5]|nr:NAD(P)-binding protein [Auricularia subglabra TFB-10046 SS5]
MDALTTTSYVFAVIGVLFLLPVLYRLLVFIYVYCPGLHDGDIDKYMWPERPYALITAATDGIGKALARELYGRGFNLVIHGRNPAKLAAVRDELLQGAKGDVRVWCAECGRERWDPAELLEVTKGLDLTAVFLVNGGTPLKSYPIDGQTDDELHEVMSLNFFFSAFVIRTLLPPLRDLAKRGPTKVCALGSLSMLYPPPYLLIYAASKMALEGLMHGVSSDERFAGRGHNLDFKYLQVGNVSSAGNTSPPNWQTPTSEAFAKDIVRRVDAPWRWACANVVHAFSAWMMPQIPEKAAQDIVAKIMVKQWGDKILGEAAMRD